LVEKTDQPIHDSRYIQQHLANERTFLAWIRTAVAIVGLGFLSTGVVYHFQDFHKVGYIIAAITGIGSVLFGGSIMALATFDYFRKRAGINTETFKSAKGIVFVIFSCLATIDILFILLSILLLI
jgi:putative membrane protein